MSSTQSVNTTMPVQPSCISTFVQDTTTVATRADGFKILTEIAAGIFELYAFVAKQVPQSLANFAVSLSHTIGILTIMSLVKRLNSFVCPNAEGKMLWERDTTLEGVVNVTAQAGLTLYNISFLGRFLNNSGVITLGKAAAPLNIAGGLGLGFAATVDIIDLNSKLNTIPQRRTDIEYTQRRFSELSLGSFATERNEKAKEAISKATESDAKSTASTAKPAEGETKLVSAAAAAKPQPATINVDKKINEYVSKRISDLKCDIDQLNSVQENNPESVKMRSRLNKWEILLNANPAQKETLFKEYAVSKAAKQEDKLYNLENEKSRAWASIVFDVTVIALIVLPFVLPAVVSVTVATAVIILGLANSIFELHTFVLEFIYTDREIKHVKVPFSFTTLKLSSSVAPLTTVATPVAAAAAAPSLGNRIKDKIKGVFDKS